MYVNTAQCDSGALPWLQHAYERGGVTGRVRGWREGRQEYENLQDSLIVKDKETESTPSPLQLTY